MVAERFSYLDSIQINFNDYHSVVVIFSGLAYKTYLLEIFVHVLWVNISTFSIVRIFSTISSKARVCTHFIIRKRTCLLHLKCISLDVRVDFISKIGKSSIRTPIFSQFFFFDKFYSHISTKVLHSKQTQHLNRHRQY